MTKKEIVKTISEELGLTQLKTKEIVQKTFDAIIETLVSDKRIELRNFGVFEVKKRKARQARNPRTSEKVFVPEKYVVTFKPGKEMEQRVRDLEEQEAREQQASAAKASGSAQSRDETSALSTGDRDGYAPAATGSGVPSRAPENSDSISESVGVGATYDNRREA